LAVSSGKTTVTGTARETKDWRKCRKLSELPDALRSVLPDEPQGGFELVRTGLDEQRRTRNSQQRRKQLRALAVDQPPQTSQQRFRSGPNLLRVR
jgi:hypothetical protein